MNSLKRLGISILILGLLSGETWASTPRYIQLICPVDGTKFTETGVGSMTVFGQDSDLSLFGLTGSLYESHVHSCPQCHFSGTEADFKQAFSPEIKNRVLTEFSSYKPHQHLDSLDEVDFTLILYDWQGRSAVDRALVALMGSYLSPGPKPNTDSNTDNINDLNPVPTNNHRHFLRKSMYQAQSLKWLKQALNSGEIEADQQMEYMYLIGEFYRHFGRFNESIDWFQQALRHIPEISNEDIYEAQSYQAFQERIEQQLSLAQKHISHAMD